MDLRKLKTLIDLVAESGIAELEITEGEGKVRIVKFSPMMPNMTVSPGVAPAPAAAGPEVTATTPTAGAPHAAASEGSVSSGYVVKSPMVGTFYRAPTPGGTPFVKQGDRVKVKDALCIIEAMKLLNEIEAEREGVIEKILVEDAEPVEFGQPLFIIA